MVVIITVKKTPSNKIKTVIITVKKTPSNKTTALTKSMNMDIWMVSTSNQLFTRCS